MRFSLAYNAIYTSSIPRHFVSETDNLDRIGLTLDCAELDADKIKHH